jgi:hypothetical protein
MEGLINARKIMQSLDMEDAPNDFKRFCTSLGFCTSLAAIGPLTSMLEDEHYSSMGEDCYSKYYVA